MSPQQKGYSYRIIGFWAGAISILTVVFVMGMAVSQNNADHIVLKSGLAAEVKTNAEETKRSKANDEAQRQQQQIFAVEQREMKIDVKYIKEAVTELKNK